MRISRPPQRAEMADLEQAVRKAKSPVAGKAAAVARAASEEPEAGRGEGPADAMQLLVAALNTGNPQEARKYISGDPQACDTFINTMTAKRQLLDAIKKRLGSVPEIPMPTRMSNIDGSGQEPVQDPCRWGGVW